MKNLLLKISLKALFTLGLITVIAFSTNAQFTIGGTAAALPNDCFRITSAANSQAGYVYQNAALNLNDSFNYKFRVYLGTNNGGADGIVFVLRGTLGTPYIGTGGGGLGFENLSGANVGGTVGVEVDTWQNANVGDPVVDHIGITSQANTNHTGPTALSAAIQASATSPNVEDGNWHTLNIRWDPVTLKLEVYLDCDFRVQYQGDLITNIFNGDSLVHWGFVGTTGGANNLQQFCFTEPIDSLFNYQDSFAICAGSSVQLNAGTTALNYLWSPSGNLSNATIGNPVASPGVTTNYVVTASYQCDTIVDTVKVKVLTSNFTIDDTIVNPLCNGDCDGSIDLTVTGPSIYGYTWNNTSLTEDISGLCAGVYSVTVVDTVPSSPNFLCFAEKTMTITQPTALVPSIINPTKTSCPNSSSCDASALAQISGGVAPYSFLWSNGESLAQADGLCPDSNFVTVTDANGCDTSSSVFILVPNSIITNADVDTLICITNGALLNVGSTGGTPPYTYTWFNDSVNGNIFSANQSSIVFPLVDTEYYVESTDANNCLGDTSVMKVLVRPELGMVLPLLDTICPGDLINATAEGIGGDSNYTFSWSSGAIGSSVNLSSAQPAWFKVTVSDACGTPSFIDSVFLQVGGYSNIISRLRLDDDTLCVGEQTLITATAAGGFEGPVSYKFSWEHTSNPNSILVLKPSKTTTYYITVEDECISKAGLDSITVYVGEPEIPRININPKRACAEADVTFLLRSFDENSRYDWTIGDIKANNHQYDTLVRNFSLTNCYDVSLNILTEYGCKSSVVDTCAFEVLQKPAAAFSHQPSQPSNIDPFVLFKNESANGNKFKWEVQGQVFDNDSLLNFEFEPSPFEEEVRLIAIHSNGCADTISKMFTVIQEPVVYIPNSFSPNGDGKNDVFYVVGENIDFEEFQLAVYDRWGTEVFFSKNPLSGWDGRIANTDEIAPIGTYAFVVKYLNSAKEVVTKKGAINLGITGIPRTGFR